MSGGLASGWAGGGDVPLLQDARVGQQLKREREKIQLRMSEERGSVAVLLGRLSRCHPPAPVGRGSAPFELARLTKKRMRNSLRPTAAFLW